MKADRVLAFANGKIELGKNSKIESTIQNDCIDEGSKIFSCIPYDSLTADLNPAVFLSNYNQRFGAYEPDLTQAIRSLQSNFTVYVLSFDEIMMKNSLINAASVGFCAKNISMTRTDVISNGKGCQSDQGSGRGST